MLLSGDHEKVRQWRLEQSRAKRAPSRSEAAPHGIATIPRPRGSRFRVRRFFFATTTSRAMSSVIDSIERAQLRQGLPPFAPGDRVHVHFQVIEGTRKRTQVFEGVVLRRQGSGARETFTVRKQSFGVGVERTFPLHSPKIEKLEVAARGDVRRAKLYYLRGRIGKAARVAERRWGIDEDMVSSAPARPRAGRGRRRGRQPGGGRAGRGRAGRRGRRPRQSDRGRAAEAEAPEEAEATETDAEADARGGARGGGDRGRRSSEEPRTRSRPKPVTPTRTPRPETLDPEAEGQRRRPDRVGRHRRAGPRAGAGDTGLGGQAVPDPLGIDGTDARRRPAGPRQPLHLPLQRSHDRRRRRLPPAGRRRNRGRMRRRCPRREPEESACRARSRPPQESSQNFIKRIVAGPRRHALDQRRPPGGQRRREDRRALHHPLRNSEACNLPKTITIPRLLLHDGRQPWSQRRQPLLGTRCRSDWIIGEAFATYWPPDRIGDPLGALRLFREDRARELQDSRNRRAKRGGLIELVVIVALALGLALAIQAWVVKPYQIPSGSMEPTLDVGQRVLVNRFIYHFSEPKIGDIVVFHPPAGRRQQRPAECGVLVRRCSRSNRESLPEADRSESSQTFIKRIVAGPAGHALDQRRPPGRERRREDRRALHQPLRQRHEPAICRRRSRSRPATSS